MANEMLYAGLADSRTAEILSGQFLYLLASRESLPSHPALMYAGDVAGRGSLVTKVPTLGLNGYDLPTSVADGASVANTAFTDGSITITVGRFSQAFEMSDTARMSDTGLLNPQVFAQSSVVNHSVLMTSLIAEITDGFTATAGSTGVDMTVANYMTAIGTLEVANVQGPYLSILHPQQIADLRQALAASSGGALQWMPATAAQIMVLGTGYRGSYLGVDIFSTGLVPTANAGADRAGGMFGRGAVLWADSSIVSSGSADELVIGGKLMIERDRTARAASTALVSHSYVGVSMGINAAGVSIITDA